MIIYKSLISISQIIIFIKPTLMKKQRVEFVGKMKGQAFNRLEQTYLGIPVLLAPIKTKVKKNEKVDVKCQTQERIINVRRENIISAMIEIQTKEASRKNVDLLCLLDISASMSGQKLQQVKETMLALILGRGGTQFLQEGDRLCVVLFDHQAKTLFDFKNTNAKNKAKMAKQVKQIESRGGTSFNAGLYETFKNIKNRTNKKNVLSIFLLSDGMNSDDKHPIAVLKEFQDENSDNFSLHTFGFGQNYDQELMTKIAMYTRSQAFAVTDINDVQKDFQKIFEKVAHTAGTDINICLKKISAKYLHSAEIHKTYGSNKLVPLDETTYQVKIPQLYSNSKKAFLFQIRIPRIQDQLENGQIEEAIFECTVKGDGIQETQASILRFQITTQEVENNNFNPDVVQNNHRIKIVNEFEEILKTFDGQNSQKTEKIINKLQVELENDTRVRQEKRQILEKELKNMKQHCQNWKKEGRKKAFAMVTSLDSKGI